MQRWLLRMSTTSIYRKEMGLRFLQFYSIQVEFDLLIVPISTLSWINSETRIHWSWTRSCRRVGSFNASWLQGNELVWDGTVGAVRAGIGRVGCNKRYNGRRTIQSCVCQSVRRRPYKNCIGKKGNCQEHVALYTVKDRIRWCLCGVFIDNATETNQINPSRLT